MISHDIVFVDTKKHRPAELTQAFQVAAREQEREGRRLVSTEALTTIGNTTMLVLFFVGE